MSESTTPISSAKLQDILLGKAKPANDREAIHASTALMWKQAFETAMRPLSAEDSDPLAAPQRQSIREAQAQWMGVEAAVAFGQSLTRQLGHAAAQQSVVPGGDPSGPAKP